jgi:hypothetical protein
MITITLHNKSANDISLIVEELKNFNLISGRDYEFKYFHSDWNSTDGNIPKKTEFVFKEEKTATWFVLRWS